jgi:quinol monooxygenase YgiN
MSVLELARIGTRPGEGDALEARMQAAIDELGQAPGAVGARAYRCVEEPDAFVFAIEWDSVDAHLAYRESEAFGRYRAHIADLLGGPPEFAHWRLVAQ